MNSFLGKFVSISVLLLSTVVAADTWGESWRALKSDDSGASYYDLDSRILISQGVFRVWEQYVYTEESITKKIMKYGSKYEGLKSSLTLWEINCTEKNARIISRGDYSHDGKVIAKTKEGADPWPWDSYPPGSLGGRLIQAICAPP